MSVKFSCIKKLLIKILRKIIIFIKGFIDRYIFAFIPVDDHCIIFDSFMGRGYSCNPKAIYEYIRDNEEFSNYKKVWCYRKGNFFTVDDCIMVRYRSLKYYYYLAKSKYWIFNSKLSVDIHKKKDQVYVQTWHGTPLKKLAKDIDIGEDKTFYRSEMSRAEMVKSYEDDEKRYDYLISPNKFSTEKFQSAFGVAKEKVLEIGYPRNDILINADEERIIGIKKKLNIPLDKKILLYAPTWRDNAFNAKGYVYKPEADFKKWKEELSDEWFLIYKPHYLIVNDIDKEELGDFVYLSSNGDDINDLYLISDLLITDYSSVFFDFGVLRKPILFYMHDLEEYKDNLRGFYLDIFKDLPGPIIEDEDKLLNSVININNINKEYSKSYEEFYERFCSLEDGNSSKRLVEAVFNLDEVFDKKSKVYYHNPINKNLNL